MNELRARPPYGQPINWTNTMFFALTPVVGIAGIWLYARSYGIVFNGDEPLPHWYLVQPDGTGLRSLPHLYGAGEPLDWLP